MDPKILEAIPGANPSGANLRYELIYGEIRARVQRARGQVLPHPGDFDFDSTEEDWSFVVRACREVLERRSKDLLIAAWLTEAQFAVDGFAGLLDGLDILRGLAETFWETLYPEIENGDVEARLRVFELVDTRLANGVRSSPESPRGTTPNVLLMMELRMERKRVLDECLNALKALTNICEKRFGYDAPEFAELRLALTGMMSADTNLIVNLRALLQQPRGYPADPKLKELPEELNSAVADISAPQSVAAPPRAAAAPSPAPSASEGYTLLLADPVPQKVVFTLTAPQIVTPKVPFELFVWAHEPQERSRVLARAREALHVRDVLERAKGPVRIASGTVLSVRLGIPGAVIAEPEDTMLWDGESTSVSFVITLPELGESAKSSGVAHIYANGVQVAKISFVLSTAGMVDASGVRYRRAFASYASADRDAVLGRIQGIHKVAPDLEVFLDVLSLRSGQNWEKELWRVIPASDIFYLFWSTDARKSEWVEKEWRCALSERGIEFIDPIPLESPQESPPPPELSSLHFNDWMLAFRRGNSPGSQ